MVSDGFGWFAVLVVTFSAYGTVCFQCVFYEDLKYKIKKLVTLKAY